MRELASRACAILLCVSAFVASCSSGSNEGGSGSTPPNKEVVSKGVVGVAGGSVNGDGVTLAIPAGALGSDQEIRITRTTEAAPSGIEAISPLYRFEPDGLTFKIPVRVTFTIAGSASDVAVFWSSSTTSGYDTLPSQLSATTVAADVVHFSRGLAGRKVGVDPDSDSGGVDATEDAPANGDSGSDGDAANSDAASCGGCPSGLSCCGAQCRNLSTDSLNCGKCGTACGTGAPLCVNGVCKPPDI